MKIKRSPSEEKNEFSENKGSCLSNNKIIFSQMLFKETLGEKIVPKTTYKNAQ